MTPRQLADQIGNTTLDDVNALLTTHAELLSDNTYANDVAEALKADAEVALRNDISACQKQLERMTQFASVSQTPSHTALIHLARGNMLFVGIGDYTGAISQFDQALTIYSAENNPTQQARVNISKIGALVNLGRYDEAAATGTWSRNALQASGQTEQLVVLTLNLANGLYMRRGDDATALQLLDETADIVRAQLGSDHLYIGYINQNRATSLRNLGRFDEAIAASEDARSQLTELGYAAEAMRAQQNLAITYYVISRYNEALQLLEDVKAFWINDGRMRDAAMVDLFISDSLLNLFRFGEAAERCELVATDFRTRGESVELAQTLVNLAKAYRSVGRFEDALTALNEADGIYSAENHQFAAQLVQLERAFIRYQQSDLNTAAQIATESAATFAERNLILPEVQARLLLLQVAIDLEDGSVPTLLDALAEKVVPLEIPSLLYQYHLLRGDWLQQNGDRVGALAAYDEAANWLELIKGRLMVEFRVTFDDNTYAVYEKAAANSIELGQFEQALNYAERAKSRALLDLIAFRLDLSIQAQRESDQPIVDELLRLRAERDRLYRRLEGSEDLRRADTASYEGDMQAIRKQVVTHEKQITALWHQLLIRNTAYARDKALWQVHTEPVQHYLAADELMLEYFWIQGRYVLFVVTKDDISVRQISAESRQIDQWIQFFSMNCMRAVPNRHNATLMASLHQQANAILQKLHASLFGPVVDLLAQYKKLVIVPHNALHYLPFHALHDGAQYLVESHEVRYLPNASLLRFSQGVSGASQENCVAFGYSSQKQLPYTISEVNTVAEIMDGVAFVEEAVTIEQFRAVANGAHVLHLATHGEFNADNSLFSGLTLADGQLVTLDVFNLSLQASLVTLSACQTGRSQVSRGDELMGLMRGFLSAGAASLLLTHWSVEDHSTAVLMEQFYRELKQGLSKGSALRQAQRRMIYDEMSTPISYAHPYFWATFFLVGHAGAL